jgi:hypothetical protein
MSGPESKAEALARRGESFVVRAVQRVGEAGALARWCQYGHAGCASEDGGACVDELLGLAQERFGLDAEDL